VLRCTSIYESNAISYLADIIMYQLCCFTGTTWIQHIVWLIVNGTNGEDDGLNISQRYQFIEFDMAMADLGKSTVRQPKSPELLKSHVSYNCLPAAVENGHGKVKALE